MKLFIRNMVCQRCKMVLKSELEKLGIHYLHLSLGEVEITDSLSDLLLNKLDISLKHYGLELILDRRAQIIEKIKSIIIEKIHYSEEDEKINFTKILSQSLNYDYKYLSNLFSEVHGTTIEHYIINQKIERVKELIIYNELNLSEIAWKLHYSSVQHLSAQFKKVTGLTPSFFKKMTSRRRKDISNL